MRASSHRFRLSQWALVATGLVVSAIGSSAARAQDPMTPSTSASASTSSTASGATPDAPEDPIVVAARKEFLRGTELVRKERWGEALDAFEKANKSKPHAITMYNIAQCQRAMGQYTLARRAFTLAVSQDAAAQNAELPESVRSEAKGLVSEIDHIITHVHVTLAPEDASVAIDGRPIERDSADGAPLEFVAGTLAPAPGAAPGAKSFDVIVNPGAHVFTVSRPGYQDVVVNKSFGPGAQAPLSLELDKLPATLHVTSTLKDAIVRVNDADVGNPPVEISRVAGSYHVKVTRKGFVTYDTEVAARPGERVEIDAPMREEKKSITREWWFWTAAGALVIGAATSTYFLTRPEPTRPPPDGGGLGWALKVP
jgi:hypothetical protein